MNYSEMTGDLFKDAQGRILAHCISADFALGAGIAVKFREMGVRDMLKREYPDYLSRWNKGECIVTETGGVTTCNLITKRYCNEKPTYENLQSALEGMKDYINSLETDKPVQIGMPLIGCGIDGLEWDKVSSMVKDTFKDCNADILVVKFDKERAKEKTINKTRSSYDRW